MAYIRRMKKNGKEYLSLCDGKRVNGKTVQRHIRYIGVVPTIGDENTSKKDKKVIRDTQIIEKLLAGKLKEDLAYLYDVTPRTIENIRKRYNEHGMQGLIHTRTKKYETVKVSSPEQAAIITDIVQNPNKDAKEIKRTTFVKSTISEIEKIILPIKKHLIFKKKIKLEIE
jgi:transposase